MKASRHGGRRARKGVTWQKAERWALYILLLAILVMWLASQPIDFQKKRGSCTANLTVTYEQMRRDREGINRMLEECGIDNVRVLSHEELRDKLDSKKLGDVNAIKMP